MLVNHCFCSVFGEEKVQLELASPVSCVSQRAPALPTETFPAQGSSSTAPCQMGWVEAMLFGLSVIHKESS